MHKAITRADTLGAACLRRTDGGIDNMCYGILEYDQDFISVTVSGTISAVFNIVLPGHRPPLRCPTCGWREMNEFIGEENVRHELSATEFRRSRDASRGRAAADLHAGAEERRPHCYSPSLIVWDESSSFDLIPSRADHKADDISRYVFPHAGDSRRMVEDPRPDSRGPHGKFNPSPHKKAKGTVPSNPRKSRS